MSAKSILIVDDNEDDALLLARPLRKAGYEIVTASSGIEALHRYRERRADVCLVDQAMPGMDGLAFLAEQGCVVSFGSVGLGIVEKLGIRGEVEHVVFFVLGQTPGFALTAKIGCAGAIVARDHLLDRCEDFLDAWFGCLPHLPTLSPFVHFVVASLFVKNRFPLFRTMH